MSEYEMALGVARRKASELSGKLFTLQETDSIITAFLSTYAGEGEAVAFYWRTSTEEPLVGYRIIAIHTDGSGAFLAFRHEHGFFDQEGDEFQKLECSRWAYLPAGERLWIEDNTEDPFDLPEQPAIPDHADQMAAKDARIAYLEKVLAFEQEKHSEWMGRATKVEAVNAELVEGLRPFADFAKIAPKDGIPGIGPIIYTYTTRDGSAKLTTIDCHHARTLIQTYGGSDE